MRGGLQRDALHLYRLALREIAKKPPAAHPDLRSFARTEFEKRRGVSAANFTLIEHLLRQGHKQVALMRDTAVTSLQRL
jgi:succinate dehydrogenase assembly factor 1